ncbi:hypothetical protein OL229_14860 [Neisseriaceae bacterium JH1-16]|nr:hypothetical protein [Neisseriaceae bacterium JH1-16]
MNTTLFGTAAYPLATTASPLGANPPATTPTLLAALDDENQVSISDQGKAKRQATLSPLALLQQTQSAAQSQGSSPRKSAARAKIEMLKKQMDMLRSMLAGLDPRMAKALLGQLKQIAQELKQTAAVLGESDGGGSVAGGQSAALPVSIPTAPSGDAASGGTTDDGQDAAAVAQQAQQVQQARQQVVQQQTADAQDGEAGQAAAATASAPSTSQVQAEVNALQSKVEQQGKEAQPAGQGGDSRGSDAELIMSAVRKLKLLLAAVKSQLKSNDDLKRTERQTQAAENIAEQLAAGGDAQLSGDAGGGSVGVSVQA